MHADDVTILEWVRDNGGILLSCDLDFGTILAATGAHGPSVIQIRGSDVLPELVAELVASVIIDLEADLRAGVLVSLDMDRAGVRVLPLRV